MACSPGVAAVVAIERRVIGELAREIEAALALEQDLVEQGLVAGGAAGCVTASDLGELAVAGDAVAGWT